MLKVIFQNTGKTVEEFDPSIKTSIILNGNTQSKRSSLTEKYGRERLQKSKKQIVLAIKVFTSMAIAFTLNIQKTQ